MVAGIRLDSRYRAKLDASTQPKADRDQDWRPGRCLAQAGREAAQQSANSQKPEYTIWIATGLLERSTAFGMETAQWKTGFQVSKTEGPELLVVTVLPNTPAAAAGIIAGDVITEINGLPVSSDGQKLNLGS